MQCLNKIKLFFIKIDKSRGNFLGFPLYFWIIIISLVLFKLFLLSAYHIVAFGYAMHDDGLFVSIANNILRLRWLGDFNNMTLVKGPGYPLWIAFNFLLGVPLLFSQNLFYILACITLIIALKPLLLKKYYLLAIFTAILFNPSTFSQGVATRVIREGIYGTLVLFIVAFSIGVLLRRKKNIKEITIWICGLSVALSFFWVTREEGVWILPFLVPILLFAAFKLWREKKDQWKSKIILLAAPFIILFLSIIAVASINYFKYGLFTVVEFKNSEFVNAYGSLLRVKDIKWRPFVPVSKEKRMKIYKISPSFKKLEPFLEGQLGRDWARNAPESQQSKDAYEGDNYEIMGGWFMWAFRDSVKAIGYYQNSKDTMNFYKQISNEIDTACEKKELDCFPKRNTMMSPFYREQARPIFNSFIVLTKYIVNFEGIDVKALNSVGNEESLELFSRITHEPVYTDKTETEVTGWAFSPSEKIILAVINGQDEFEKYNVEIINSPDVYKNFFDQGNSYENAKKARFRISTSCINNCFLLVSGEGNLKEKIPLDIGESSMNIEGKLFVYLDSLVKNQNNQKVIPLLKKDNIKLTILSMIGNLYKSVTGFLAVLSIFIFVITTLTQFKKLNVIYFVNLSLLAAIVARVAMLAVIDATSFSVLYNYYVSPVDPMLILFILLNLISVIPLFFRRKRS